MEGRTVSVTPIHLSCHHDKQRHRPTENCTQNEAWLDPSLSLVNWITVDLSENGHWSDFALYLCPTWEYQSFFLQRNALHLQLRGSVFDRIDRVMFGLKWLVVIEILDGKSPASIAVTSSPYLKLLHLLDPACLCFASFSSKETNLFWAKCVHIPFNVICVERWPMIEPTYETYHVVFQAATSSLAVSRAW